MFPVGCRSSFDVCLVLFCVPLLLDFSKRHSFEELLVSSFPCFDDIVTEQPTVNMTTAEDRLWCLRQCGWGLVRYVKDFLELTNQVSWIDTSLCVCFRLGLDDDIISCDRPTCSFSLIELINLVLN